MSKKSPWMKSCVWILLISQVIINIALLVGGINSYINPPAGSMLQLLFLTLYRSWLMFFGWKKIDFLCRKTRRWNCEIFKHSVCYTKLPDEESLIQNTDDSNLVLSVSQQHKGFRGVLSPTETEYEDPHGYHVRYDFRF